MAPSCIISAIKQDVGRKSTHRAEKTIWSLIRVYLLNAAVCAPERSQTRCKADKSIGAAYDRSRRSASASGQRRLHLDHVRRRRRLSQRQCDRSAEPCQTLWHHHHYHHRRHHRHRITFSCTLHSTRHYSHQRLARWQIRAFIAARTDDGLDCWTKYHPKHSANSRWTRNLAIANRSRVSCAHKVTAVNFQQDSYFPLPLKRVAALGLPCVIFSVW